MNRKRIMSMLGVLPQFGTDALNEERFVDTVESGMEEMNEWKDLPFRNRPVLLPSESGVFSGKKSRSKPGEQIAKEVFKRRKKNKNKKTHRKK